MARSAHSKCWSFLNPRAAAAKDITPWDLLPGSMMTNATVAEVVDVDKARRMTLRYKDGEQTVVVPANAPVVTFEPGPATCFAPART